MTGRLHPYHHRPHCWWLIALWAAISSSLASLAYGAGEPVWVTVQAMAPIRSGHKDVARYDAIAQALQKAVDKVVADKISVDALMVQLKLSGHILGAIPYARIVEQQVISEEQRPCRAGDAEASEMCHQVRLKAAVVEESAGMNPQFLVEATVNQHFFNDGDAMQIQLSATQDCFGYIFLLMEDGRVMRLLPNRYESRHRLKANQPFVFPDAKDAARGLRLVAHALEDRPATQEAFYCLALKEPLDHRALDTIPEGLFQLYGQHATFMRALIRQVARIPMDKRAETMEPYQIISTSPTKRRK